VWGIGLYGLEEGQIVLPLALGGGMGAAKMEEMGYKVAEGGGSCGLGRLI
jgi:hypothetical protein